MRNTLQHFIVLTIFSFLGRLSFGQVIADYSDISIFFGDKQKSGANIEDFIKTKSNNLLCVQNELSFFNIFSRNSSKYSFSYITDYKIPATHPITFYGNGKKSSLTHYTVLGDNALGISLQTTFMKKEQKIYYHFINLSSQGKSNHGFSLEDYFAFHNEIDLSQITLVNSENKKYASMIYVHEGSPENYRSIKYLNFKEDSPLPQSGNFIFPFPTKEYEFLDFYIKDEHIQFIISGHYSESSPANSWINKQNYFKSITIGKLANQVFKYETLEDKGIFYTEIGLYNTGDQILLSGLYSPFIDGKVEGVFTATINNEGKISNKKYTSFSNEIKTSISGFSLIFLNDQSTIKNEYAGFDLIDFQSTDDGYIGIVEFNALEYRYGSADVPGATNTVDSYFWSNDIIVFKLNLKGEMDWDRIIPKYQRSINDGGYHLSNAAYLSSEQLHLFFNDNQLNYNEDGAYSQNGDLPIAAQFNSGKNTIAHVSLRLEDGYINRKSTIGKEETDLLFVPLLARPFTQTKKLMIYGRSGNKQRIGSISFHD
jgi:hypothetical protein